jgi:hypothetical protein
MSYTWVSCVPYPSQNTPPSSQDLFGDYISFVVHWERENTCWLISITQNKLGFSYPSSPSSFQSSPATLIYWIIFLANSSLSSSSGGSGININVSPLHQHEQHLNVVSRSLLRQAFVDSLLVPELPVTSHWGPMEYWNSMQFVNNSPTHLWMACGWKNMKQLHIQFQMYGYVCKHKCFLYRSTSW